MNILDFLKVMVTNQLGRIAGLLSFQYRKLKFAGREISLEDKIIDFMEVFKTTRLFLIFNLLGFVVFNILPQGNDVIRSVVEDCESGNLGTLISLIVGLTGWCLVSEFGARYKIYISDNSGLSLTEERVNFRKEAQKVVSSLYLLLPILIVFFSVLIVGAPVLINWNVSTAWPILIVLFLLFLMFIIFSKFYLDFDFIEQQRGRNVWYKIRKEELEWANKLLGIYNDYVLMVRKSSNYKNPNDPSPQSPPPPDPDVYFRYLRFTEAIDDKASIPSSSPYKIEDFPRNYLKKDELPPTEFEPVTFKEDNKRPVVIKKTSKGKDQYTFAMEDNPDGYYRWIFKCNPAFYRSIHLQIRIIAVSSILFVLFLCLPWNSGVFIFIGSPALVCLAFACWLGVYIGVLYLDSRYRKTIKFPLRWGLLVWFIFVSYINNDHPVQPNLNTTAKDTRPTLHQHFNQWRIKNNITGKDTVKILLINAEGGALRTGAFTSFVLAKIVEQQKNTEILKKIYAFSSVSGGSVGIGFFNAISYLDNDNKKSENYYTKSTKEFFSQDMLAPVIAKMFYSDILNGFWPRSIQSFDKAIALEKAWEKSYHNTFDKQNSSNTFSSNYLSIFNEDLQNNALGVYPVWLINTTEVETGRQALISNVKLRGNHLDFERDILSSRLQYGINYSTAIDFSTRFPLISPPAAIKMSEDITYHYVDGGYVENTGSKSMYELLLELQDEMKMYRIVPYIINIRYGDKPNQNKTTFLNEVNGIVSGIYNVRNSTTEIYSKLSQSLVDSMKGKIVEVPLLANSKQVPLNWLLSKKSLDYLIKQVDSIINNKNSKLSVFLVDYNNPRPIRNSDSAKDQEKDSTIKKDTVYFTKVKK